MGKSLKGKELGSGISQRKDGFYQGRFVNRFGKRQTFYASTLSELRQKLRNAQYEDEKELNVVTKDITLDEWFVVWMETCKKNCRDSTKESYITHYKRIQKALGWRKLTSLNLVIMQQAINELVSDNARKNSKKILVDMFEKAIASDLLIKNIAKQINPVITKEDKKERVVLSAREEEWFLKQAEGTFYYNLYVVALDTGLRIGELMDLMWEDVKTKNGKRDIPLTSRAYDALKRQRVQNMEISLKWKTAPAGCENLVFVTRNNRPTQQFLVQECMLLITRHIQESHPDFEAFSPHTFRHTFATRAIENGMQPKTLQKLLGHGSLQMTMDLYCHVTEDTLFDAMKLMEKKCV